MARLLWPRPSLQRAKPACPVQALPATAPVVDALSGRTNGVPTVGPMLGGKANLDIGANGTRVGAKVQNNGERFNGKILTEAEIAEIAARRMPALRSGD